MGPLKAINGNVGRSRLPDKEKLFPELSSSHPVPKGWPFRTHSPSSFPLFLVLRGAWGGRVLCWDAELGEFSHPFPEHESVGYDWSWLFGHCVVICILAYARTSMEVSFLWLRRLDGEEELSFFWIRRPSLSIRASSLTSLSLLWAPHPANPPPHFPQSEILRTPLSSLLFLHVPFFLQNVCALAPCRQSESPTTSEQLRTSQNWNSIVICKACKLTPSSL